MSSETVLSRISF